MKRLLSILLAMILLLSTMTFGFAGAVKQQNKEASDKKESQSEVTISASPAKKEFAWGDEVVLDIEAKNNTGKDCDNVQIRVLKNKVKYFKVDDGCAATIDSLKAGETKTVQLRIRTKTPNTLQRIFVVPFYWIVESVSSLFSKKNGGDSTVQVKVGLFNYRLMLEVEVGPEAEKEPEIPTEPAKSVTVSFRLNYDGATEAIPSQTFKAGQKAEYPDFPWREGYTFLGWFTDAACENAFNFDTVINEDTVLYAGWMEGSPTNLTLEYLAALLTIEYATGDYPDSVTKDLGLPITFEEYEGVFVMWRSSNNAVIAPDGEVNRPSENTDVTLTATITYNGETKDVSFPVTVIADHSAAAEEIEEHSVKDVLAMNGGEAEIEYNEEETQVVMIDGKFYEPVVNDVGDALDAVQSVHAMIGMENPYEELDPYSINADEYGASYAFKQTYQGYEIYGRALTVVTDKNGKADLLNSGAVSTEVLKTVNLTPAITQAEAEAIAKEAGGEGTTVDPEQTYMVIFPLNEYRNSPVLAYVVMIISNDGIEAEEFVNAQNGEIVCETIPSYSAVEAEGSGYDELGEKTSFPITQGDFQPVYETDVSIPCYYLKDPTRKITIIDYSDKEEQPAFSYQKDGGWDAMAVSAYTNLITVYDWYKNIPLERDSIDDKGMPIKANVHYPGRVNNAGWNNGKKHFEFYDNGIDELGADHTDKPSLAACLDFVGHEYTHGVFQSEVPVDTSYSYNSIGAINEGYADVFGCLIDLIMGGDTEWKMGEKRIIDRDIKNPESHNYPAHISSWNYRDPTEKTTTFLEFKEREKEKSSIAHKDSTLVSHAAYLMYKYGVAVEPQIMTVEQLAKLWYKSMSMGLFKDLNIDFNTVCHSVLEAAEHLEFNEEQKSIIVKAFFEEGIPSDNVGQLDIVIKHQSNLLPLDLELNGAYDSIIRIEARQKEDDHNTDVVSTKLAQGTYIVKAVDWDEPGGFVNFTGKYIVNKDQYTPVGIPVLEIGSGSLSGKIQSASTQPLPNATIRLRNGFNFKEGEVLNTTTTSETGEYEIQLDSGYYTMEVQCDGFETAYQNIAVNADEDKVVEVVLSEEKAYGDYRVELTWGDAVSDLDAHLEGTSGITTPFHIDYYSKTAVDADGDRIGELDKDDTVGSGKETITFTTEPGGTYTYYAQCYSLGGTIASSEAKVTVYFNDELVDEYVVDASENPTSRKWEVFKIEDGEFFVVDALR